MIHENKFFKTSLGIICIFGGTLALLIFLTTAFRGESVVIDPEDPKGPPNNYWVPTEEDIKYQDSMFQIIEQTQREVDTIKERMEGIIYKLDRLYYEDGSWDSIKVPVGGDTIKVKATMYHPVEEQCDSDPLITADGSKIDPYNVSDWNWIAVSRDLLVSGGGCLNYGDSVYVVAGHKTGWYVVHDTMNKRWTNRIDFLESLGTEAYRYNEAELIVNS